MSEHEERRSDPLPRAWLPEPSGPPADDPAWEAQARRIVRAAAPELERRRSEAPSRAGERSGRSGEAGWWTGLERWLGPAAGLAAAAALLLAVLGPEPPGREPVASPALAAAAADGDPAALWRAAGTEADPVLALIALEPEEEIP